MSGVAQRAGQVDIGAAAAVSLGRAPAGQITRAGYPRPRLPQCPVNMAGAALPQTDQLIWQNSLAWPLLPHGVDHVAMRNRRLKALERQVAAK